MLFSLTTIISCNENDSGEFNQSNSSVSKDDSKIMAKMSDEILSIALSEDADFRALSDMIVL